MVKSKRSIGSLMRKKLSDITNSQLQDQTIHPTQQENALDTCFIDDKACIQQLLKERVALMKLVAEKSKMIEWSRAEMQMVRAQFQKLQLQNLNLAQSNSHMLAELNLGRERIKAMQHEILWRTALLKGDNVEVVIKDEDEKSEQPYPKDSTHKQNSMSRRRCMRRRSTGSSSSSSTSTASSTNNARKEKVEDKRHCAKLGSGELKPLENLFEIEDAKYHVIQSRRSYLRGSQDENGNNSTSRNEAPRCSFGIPLRKSVENAKSYKDTNSSKTKSQFAKTRQG
ncbi:PREDICTED: shugoshin-1-like isoform X2 [Lupinus angustifolius]|uniref:shugoshin-1-like isoform X2 n=1 Tax=Lupinus angustifolius TaxID=3871 RepID=UPI00092FBA6C|nr:PREDICTED: shugoshin-1-like isoform X2 [Lupinus angustifolius]